MSIIAIDPGQNGGIAIEGLDWDTVIVERMPDTYPGIMDLFQRLSMEMIRPRAVLEKVGFHVKGNNASASVKFGRHMGHLEMALYAANIPVRWVTPKQWQRLLGTLPKDKNARKRRIKEIMAGYHPELHVTLWNADALGILEWAKKNERATA